MNLDEKKELRRQKFIEEHPTYSSVTNKIYPPFDYKAEIIEKYGGKCVCCGESHRLFLTMDHINNDGHLSRTKKGRKRGGHSLYAFIKKMGFPKDMRLLCFNCNFGRNFNGGTCPHIS